MHTLTCNIVIFIFSSRIVPIIICIVVVIIITIIVCVIVTIVITIIVCIVVTIIVGVQTGSVEELLIESAPAETALRL